MHWLLENNWTTIDFDLIMLYGLVHPVGYTCSVLLTLSNCSSSQGDPISAVLASTNQLTALASSPPSSSLHSFSSTRSCPAHAQRSSRSPPSVLWARGPATLQFGAYHQAPGHATLQVRRRQLPDLMGPPAAGTARLQVEEPIRRPQVLVRGAEGAPGAPPVPHQRAAREHATRPRRLHDRPRTVPQTVVAVADVERVCGVGRGTGELKERQ